MSHTPGPWRSDHEGGFIVLNGSHAYSIRDICSDDRGWNAGDLDLMAAAPDLLLWLKALVHYDDGSSEQGSYGHELLHKCKAVIAKAEGRE